MPNYTLQDLGYDKLLLKGTLFDAEETGDTPESESVILSGTSAKSITSGELNSNLTYVNGVFQSSNFVSGSAGWKINSNGDIEANSLTLIGGTIKYAKTSFSDSTNAGYYMGSEGIYFGAASDASKLKYTIADGTFDFIGTVSSRSTLTLANSINASGQLVTDIVNARLDSSAKTILSDFNFGAVDYAGAVKAGTITWNTTTGAITGGSGVVVYRGGIVGAAAGVAKFTLDASTGAATFAGTLSAPTGSLGAITTGLITLDTTGYLRGGKTGYTDTTNAGFFIGYDTAAYKLYFGTASDTKYLKYDGTNLTMFGGTISGGSLNINDKAIINSSGIGTFIGLSALNMKAYTNFEAAGRFILTGDVAPTFTNTGMNVAPGTTANHYARCLWSIVTKVFAGNPTFTCTFSATAGFASGVGSAFIGLGIPNITGTTFTETGEEIAGFHLKKSANATTITILQCDGSANLDYENNVDSITIENGDVIELFMKINDASIDYYVRKNGGSLGPKHTLTDYMPSLVTEEYISFYSTNKNSTDDLSYNVRCASYER